MLRRLKERCRAGVWIGEEKSTPLDSLVTLTPSNMDLRCARFLNNHDVDSGCPVGDSKDVAKEDAVKSEFPVNDSSKTKGEAAGVSPELVPSMDYGLIPEVVNLSDLDILMGRGRTIQERPSSIHFRRVVSMYRDRYDNATRKEKKLIIIEVKDALASDGYRFLTRIGEDVNDRGGGVQNKKLVEYQWVVASHDEAYRKISHNLRSLRGIQPLHGEEPTTTFNRNPLPLVVTSQTRCHKGIDKIKGSVVGIDRDERRVDDLSVMRRLRTPHENNDGGIKMNTPEVDEVLEFNLRSSSFSFDETPVLENPSPNPLLGKDQDFLKWKKGQFKFSRSVVSPWYSESRSSSSLFVSSVLAQHDGEHNQNESLPINHGSI